MGYVQGGGVREHREGSPATTDGMPLNYVVIFVAGSKLKEKPTTKKFLRIKLAEFPGDLV